MNEFQFDSSYAKTFGLAMCIDNVGYGRICGSGLLRVNSFWEQGFRGL